MDINLRLSGLDRFLTAIYGEQTGLVAMIDALGFEPQQAHMLQEECLPDVAEQFIDAIRRKLTAGDKDLWFRVLSRRYGLDGEPPASLDNVALAVNVDRETASRAETDALQKCRYKNSLQDFSKELHYIALGELSKGAARPQKAKIAGKLTRLADLQAAVDLTRMDYEAKRTEVLKKVQAERDALEAEYDPLLEAAERNASALEAEIKNDVLLGGESVLTDVYQALYMKGRVTWDTDGIDRYAAAHPEVLKYRKQGQPSVSLRKGR
jgi:hypothetical protein